MSEPMFFSNLVDKLTRRSSRAALGLLGFRNDALREFLRSAWEQDPGSPGALLADPVFEATFGWEPADATMAMLSGSLLNPRLINALAAPPLGFQEQYTFPADRRPYQHQLRAWQALLAKDDTRSVLVSSGTGSGKTECFLVPILNDLADEIDKRGGAPLTGVRALFLYPLNALIKSQRDRLVAWSEPFHGQIRFCLYNGNTPDQGKSEWSSEVPDRRTLRSQPPSILVTNATMLEYMLVRAEDRSILEQSQGRLRWIVIDEAHTYMGSQAAELTLLLRRVMHSFGCLPDQVHFVATSATIGGAGEEARRQLAEFLADVAGVSPDRVTVVTGQREIPELTPLKSASATKITSHDLAQGEAEAVLFARLASNLSVRELRSRLVEQPHRLTDLAELICQSTDASARRYTLQVLDACTRARNERHEPFLPLRGHLFERTVSGLWVCANSECSGRIGTPLDSVDWPFGAVFLERRLQCAHCGTPVFELVQCGECGAEYLAAAEVPERDIDRLRPREFAEDEDEFQQELEPAEPDETEFEIQPDTPIAHPRLLTSPHKLARPVTIAQDGTLDVPGRGGTRIYLVDPEADEMECLVCHEKERVGRPLFTPVRVGAPFLLGASIPTLLEHVPGLSEPGYGPFGGRRLITFTDSRQGTARFAVKLQQENERNYVRGLLYHSVAAAGAEAGSQKEIEETRQKIIALEPIAKGNAVLQGILDGERLKLNGLLSPSLGKLAWEEAENKLLGNDEFTRNLLPAIRELAFGQLSDRQIARLSLLREFMLRPKRQFSLEGLGLLQLHYPALDKVPVPAVFAQRGMSQQEWANLLHIAIDFFLRTGHPAVEVPADVVRWLGFPGKPGFAIAPGSTKTKTAQRPWPSARAPQAKRNRLVRLLAGVFNLDLDDYEQASQLDEMLAAIWLGLLPVLSRTEDGYRLELHQRSEIMAVREAWFCPVTRRLLPRSFRGVTPYLPYPASAELSQCKKMDMPVLPDPFWLENKISAEEWLETDGVINRLRGAGAWSDIGDRIARLTRYFRAVEHSAQISGAELTLREEAFKRGEINVLSCSTTMEMGVDIGGLTAVAMNNVPPHPANFLQRAGRAGRRGESVALSFTMCKSTPHGEAVFANPLWPFTTQLAMPRVALQSQPIVQRHINALTLATFLHEVAPDRIFKLNTGWFFESASDGQSSPCGRYILWLSQYAAERLSAGMQYIVHRTVLGGMTTDILLERVIASIKSAEKRWTADLASLLEQLALVTTKSGDSKAEVAVSMQLERLRGEYLLGELANLGFLPGYGFPTDVVPFVTTTLEDLERKKGRAKRAEREDNRSRRIGYASRNLALAIRDYCPGSDTVLDGRVYRSGGVTLNWQVPADAEAAPEIQSLRWVWRCNACGGNGIRYILPEICPECGEADANKLTRYRFLQPGGFAVDLRDHPHNDISRPEYVPVRDPVISLRGAEWMPLPHAGLGRYRSNSEGQLFYRTDGLHGMGFSLCLRCGRADSMTPTGERPPSLKGHKRLRGGKLNDRESSCPGNDESWAIVDSLRLGVVSSSDVFELQLRSGATGKSIGLTAAYTLAVAMRTALCRRLGIEDKEVGCLATPTSDSHGGSAISIFLYDSASGGAGYATQASELLSSVLRDARKILDCQRGCDSACQACVLDYDTQHHRDLLDRHQALEVLSDAFLASVDLPAELAAFGAESKLEMEPLRLALWREWQRRGGSDVRVYLGGEPNSWEPLAWRARSELVQLAEAGVGISVIAPTNVVERLTSSQKGELSTLLEFTKGSLLLAPEYPRAGSPSLPLALELGGPNCSVRWVGEESGQFAPTSLWGQEARVSRAVMPSPLPDIPSAWARIVPSSLREHRAGVVEIRIGGELDGPLMTFGERAWELVRRKVTELDILFSSDNHLTHIQYSDRYLKSPLSMLLLLSVLRPLGAHGASVSVSVQTEYMTRISARPPRELHHDWDIARDRNEIARHLFGLFFPNFLWQEDEKRHIPHARELQLKWSNGAQWTLRLDQGMGYWATPRRRPVPYPFEGDVGEQLTFLKSLSCEVEAGNRTHPTFWYLASTDQKSL